MTTDRDLRVLQVIEAHVDSAGYPPSVREIAVELGLSSTSGIQKSLQRLRQAGKITWEEGRSRTIRVIEPIS